MTIDPKTVFNTAEVYRASSIVLAGLIGRGMPHFMFPMVTCSAFSLELHLKCLVLIEGRNARKEGHNLKDIFSKLSLESKQKIRNGYEQSRASDRAKFAAIKGIPPRPPDDFEFVLNASSKAFEKFRYAYEGIVENQTGWLAGPIIDSVRARILELKPEWADIRYGFDGPLLPPRL
jgi:hypothetical protein